MGVSNQLLEVESLPPRGEQRHRQQRKQTFPENMQRLSLEMRVQKQSWPRHWKEEDEEPVFAEPMEIPAPLEITAEAMKRDGGEVLFTEEKTLEKVNAFPSTSLPAGQPNPITPILSSLWGHHQRHQDQEKHLICLKRKAQLRSSGQQISHASKPRSAW